MVEITVEMMYMIAYHIEPNPTACTGQNSEACEWFPSLN